MEEDCQEIDCDYIEHNPNWWKIKNLPSEFDIRESLDIQFKAECIRTALSTISERQREVIIARFLLGETLEETGKRFNLSRERIHQIELKVLRLLRHPERLKLLPEGVERLEKAKRINEKDCGSHNLDFRRSRIKKKIYKKYRRIERVSKAKVENLKSKKDKPKSQNLKRYWEQQKEEINEKNNDWTMSIDEYLHSVNCQGADSEL